MIVLKPFLMLASIAFVAGFAGYLAVVEMGSATMAPSTATYQAPISAPSSPTWNAGKPI